jgi:hypothetical protein
MRLGRGFGLGHNPADGMEQNPLVAVVPISIPSRFFHKEC